MPFCRLRRAFLCLGESEVAKRRNNGISLDGGHNRTMLMFTTLMLILLSFFVFIVSQSNFDESKYANAVQSIQRSFGPLTGGRLAIGVDEGLPDVTLGLDDGGSLNLPDMNLAQIRAVLAPAIIDNQASIIHKRTQRIISLSAGLVFELDDETINEKMAGTLLTFARIMAENKVPIVVEGHTDNTPPQTAGVGDNWDVSGRRALAVMQFLIDSGGLDPARLTAMAYAGSKPLYSNATPNGRARNNRVDLVLDFSQVGAEELKAMVEKATTFNFKGFDFFLKNQTPEDQ